MSPPSCATRTVSADAPSSGPHRTSPGAGGGSCTGPHLVFDHDPPKPHLSRNVGDTCPAPPRRDPGRRCRRLQPADGARRGRHARRAAARGGRTCSSRSSPGIRAASSRRSATACWSSSAAPSTPSNAPPTCSAPWPTRTQAAPEAQPMQLRIGINLGDVVIEGDDLFGDGVNVAARIEGLAEPGGVAISDSVHEHVRGRIAIDFVDRGEHEVKNIERPVHVWGWSPGMSAGGRAAAPAMRRRRSPKSRRSRCCPSTTCPAIPSRAISPTASPRTSSPTSRRSPASSSSPAIPPSPTRASRRDVRAGEPRARRALCARRQRAPRRQPRPHQRADDRRRDRRPSLGGALRPRPRPTSSRCRTR